MRPRDGGLPASDDLVERNFLGFKPTSGISTDQLDQVRTIGGVDLAAPIGVVGLLESTTAAPIIEVPSSESGLFRFTVTATTSDGISTVALYTSTVHVAIAPSEGGGPSQIISDSRSGEATSDTSIQVALEPVSGIQELVIAVDPESEAELLGERADDLAALANYDSGGARQLGDFELPTDNSNAFSLTQLAIESAAQMAEDLGPEEMSTRPILPMVVSRTRYQPMDLTVTIEPAADDLGAFPDGIELQSLVADARWVAPLEPVRVSVADRFLPFQNPSLLVAWPGTDLEPAAENDSTYSGAADVTLSPTYIHPADYPESASQHGDLPSFDAVAVGRSHSATGGEAAAAVGAVPDEPLYRETSTDEGSAGTFVSDNPYDRPYFPLPIGTFDLEDFQLPSDAVNYVPLGAYDTPDAELVEPAYSDGVPGPLGPTFQSAGLVPAPPVAITDIRSASAIRGDNPIDAIRVRLDDSIDYSTEGLSKIEAIASEIESMGLRVDIVAGASPEQVAIFVEDYFRTSSETGPDLGWVEQPWTTIGAASRVDSAISSLTRSLTILSLVAAAVLAVVVNVVRMARMEQHALSLLTSGWTRRAVIRWLLLDLWPVLVIAAAAGTTAWLLLWRQHEVYGLTVAAGAIASWALVSAVMAIVTARRARHLLDPTNTGKERRALGSVVGRITLGFAATLRRPTPTLCRLTGMVTAGVAGGAAASTTSSARAQSGRTRLAALVIDQTHGGQLLTLLALAVAGIAIAVLACYDDLIGRQPELSAMRAASWPTRRMLESTATGTAVLGGVAMVLVTPSVLAIASLQDVRPLTSALIALATIAVAVVGCVAVESKVVKSADA